MIQPRYILPAMIAASAHLALLLAFPELCPPISGTVAPQPPRTEIREVPTDIFEPPPPADPETAPVKGPKGEEAGPSLPDLAQAKSGPIEVLIDPAPPIRLGKGTAIPARIGVPDGTAEYDPSPLPRISGIGELDSIPRVRVQPAPVYPVALRQAGAQGTAMVHFVVDATGRVINATVLSATHREFGDAAARAVMHWRFEPGRRQGRPVPFQMSVPVQFHLDDF